MINNVGILKPVTLEDFNFESIWEQFEVNGLGLLRVSQALLPFLKVGSKMVLMTSRMESIADNTSGSSYGYRMSKVVLSMASKSQAHNLKSCALAAAMFVHKPGIKV
ncbi:hypothetical protein [Trichocoleus sp. FACHB-69]|uniref:hypothetical protein n=1 Tax=Trichocoleus sp. FACHB-69 TaxID=2692874 RepID=UPI00241106C8|nr:hypothetical protein [Trichocoleus sp. FACHB-69]